MKTVVKLEIFIAKFNRIKNCFSLACLCHKIVWQFNAIPFKATLLFYVNSIDRITEFGCVLGYIADIATTVSRKKKFISILLILNYLNAHIFASVHMFHLAVHFCFHQIWQAIFDIHKIYWVDMQRKKTENTKTVRTCQHVFIYYQLWF